MTLARIGKIDVRRDEDQNLKLNEILKLLVDAGYHRARVKGLPPFDKIVGGLTWCIEVCNFDIDVDLLFHENLTIGQKIALTEKIVKVLPFMKCPYSIEPHQIQGLDTIHVYPVVKWLVSLAIETRAEQYDESRLFALSEFERNFSYCIPKSDPEELLRQNLLIRDIKLKYGPKRRYRREDAAPEGHFSKAVVALLEYSEAENAPKIAFDNDMEEIDEEEERVQNLLSEKMLPEFTSSGISSVEAISGAFEKYLQLGKRGKTTADELDNLESRLIHIQRDKEAKEKRLGEVIHDLSELKEQIEDIKGKLDIISNDIQTLNNQHSITEDRTVEELSELIEATESAKKGITTFKENCHLEKEKMIEELNKLQRELENPENPISETLLNTQKQENLRLMKAREKVAIRTREVESLKRIIDDVPGRPELSQYQKRFVELYSLVNAEHHETLQFYNMYNALSDTRSFMVREVELLNSILDNLSQATISVSSLNDYIHQLNQIIEEILQSKEKFENKMNAAKIERVSVLSDLSRLQDLQLQYSKALHQFSKEVSLNELLTEQT